MIVILPVLFLCWATDDVALFFFFSPLFLAVQIKELRRKRLRRGAGAPVDLLALCLVRAIESTSQVVQESNKVLLVK